MDIQMFTDLLTQVGFPIACVIAMGAFLFHVYKKGTENNKELIDSIQKTNKEREDKLYVELTRSHEVNAKAIDTIAKYSEKLTRIENDVNDIKTDVAVLIKK